MQWLNVYELLIGENEIQHVMASFYCILFVYFNVLRIQYTSTEASRL